MPANPNQPPQERLFDIRPPIVIPSAIGPDGMPVPKDKPALSPEEVEAAEAEVERLGGQGVSRQTAAIREGIEDPAPTAAPSTQGSRPNKQGRSKGSRRRTRRLTGRAALIADKIPYHPPKQTAEEKERELLETLPMTHEQVVTGLTEISDALNGKKQDQG